MNANVHDDDYCRPRAWPFALLWATQRMPEIIFLFGIFGQIKSLRSWPQIICITRHRTSIYLLLSPRVLLLFALSITNSDEFIFTISHQIPGCCASGRRYWLLAGVHFVYRISVLWFSNARIRFYCIVRCISSISMAIYIWPYHRWTLICASNFNRKS